MVGSKLLCLNGVDLIVTFWFWGTNQSRMPKNLEFNERLGVSIDLEAWRGCLNTKGCLESGAGFLLDVLTRSPFHSNIRYH